MIPPDQKSNLRLVERELEKIISDFNKDCIILLDGDRTLCEIDTSRILNKMVNINFGDIKNGFVKYGYTYPGFKNMADIYSRVRISDYIKYSKKTADMVELYPGVIDFLEEAKQFANLCIVTSGIRGIWGAILEKHKIHYIQLIGGTHNELDDYLIGKVEKGRIAEYFCKDGQKLIAFGDSDVDSLMLKVANHAIIVINHRNNADLIPHLKEHPSLFQISFKDYYHEGIEISDFKKISNLIKNLISRG